VEVGPSTRIGTRNPRHFQRGAYDGKRFGYDQTPGENNVHCVSLDDPNIVEEIAPEYLRPCRPDGPGQLVVCIAGPADIKGSQRTTSWLNDGQWMMEGEAADMGPMVIGEESLCRIWKP
jgi:transcription elongation factor SPT5